MTPEDGGIGSAVKLMRQRVRVTRRAWGGGKRGPIELSIVQPTLASGMEREWICAHESQSRGLWYPSHEDLLATDWTAASAAMPG